MEKFLKNSNSSISASVALSYCAPGFSTDALNLSVLPTTSAPFSVPKGSRSLLLYVSSLLSLWHNGSIVVHNITMGSQVVSFSVL